MKIALVKLSALGDIVHAMIVLQFIKKHNQEIEVDWIVDGSFIEILNHHPYINMVHEVDIKKVKKKKSFFLLINELRKIRKLGPYDLVIDMQGLIKSALISRLIPAPITLGFNRFSTRESLSAIFYNKKFKVAYDENVIERNLALIANGLNISFDKGVIQNKEAFLYSSQRYKFSSISKNMQNIVLIPGASYDSKIYPYEKLAELTSKIDANFIVIWGNKKEKLIADRIKSLSPKVHVIDKISIDLLISLISQVDLVIGPDTGPTHMAWALNIPSITLFGPTPGYRNTYITKINKIIESDSHVNPLKINKQDYSITNINVSDIVNLSQDLL